MRMTTDLLPRRKLGLSPGTYPILASAALAGLMLLFGPNPLRTIAVFVFLLWAPGAAYVRLLDLREPLAALVLSVAASLVIDTLVASALLYAGLWNATAAMLFLISATLVGALLPQPRDHGPGASSDPSRPIWNPSPAPDTRLQARQSYRRRHKKGK